MKRFLKITALVLLIASVISAVALFSVFAVDGAKAGSGVKTLYSKGTPQIANAPATMSVAKKTSTNGVEYYNVYFKEGWSVEDGGYTKEPYAQFAPGTHYLKNGLRDKDTAEGVDDTDYLVIDFDISTDTNQFDQLYFQTLFYYGKPETQSDGSVKGKRTSAQSGHYVLFGDSTEDAYFAESTDKSVKIPIDVVSDDEWAHITMVVDATADTNRTMYLYYNGRFVSSRVCMTDNAVYLESVRIGLGTAKKAPDLDDESFSLANATIKSFPKGYVGELAEEKDNLGSVLYPLSSFEDLAYCLEDLPENTIAEITHADSTVTAVTKISDLDGNLKAGDSVKLYRDIARKIVVPGVVNGDSVDPAVTFDLNGHSMVEPLALADYGELDWIIRDENGELHSYTADGETVYAKGSQEYTDGAISADTLYAYLSAAFTKSVIKETTLKISFLGDTAIKYTAAVKHADCRVTYDLNGKTVDMVTGGKIPFQSADSAARIVIRDGKLINRISNPVYNDQGMNVYLVDVDLTLTNSFCDQRSGKIFFIDTRIDTNKTVVSIKSHSGRSYASVFDGCEINMTGESPISFSNLRTSSARRGSINNFVGVYNTKAVGDVSLVHANYYANEWTSADAVALSNQNKVTVSLQGSDVRVSGSAAITASLESLTDLSFVFAEGFSAVTDVYIDGSTVDAERLIISEDDTAVSLLNKNKVTAGAYSATVNVTIKRSNLKTGATVFSNTVGKDSENGAINAMLHDGVMLTSKEWAADGNATVDVQFAEGVRLAYSYKVDYPFIATLDWDESTLVGERSETTTVKMSQIFADGMILQGHKDINVYGTCASIGATIEVKLGDNTATTTVRGDGKWYVTLPPMDYAKGLTLCINELGILYPETKFENVSIGEIWMMSGQSNSVYGVYKMEDFAEYQKNADNFDNIYAFAVNQAQSIVEKTESTNSGWYKVDSKSLTKDDRYTGISAIAYVMATRLATELGKDVNVGIIDINFNGSTVEAWMSADNLAEVDPEYSKKYNAYKNFYEENGTYPTEEDVKEYGSYVASGKLYQKMACGCYNAMIAPFFDGFAIRGAIWYQGEGNAGSVTATSDGDYTAHFNGVRNSFRDAFGDEELPVFIIQIPPRVGNPFYFRALQYELAKNDDNTYLVSSLYASSTYSANELKNTNPGESMVHYERKSPVGLALADSVLENIYGIGDSSAPEIISVVKQGGAIVITFNRELTVDMGSEMLGFEIAGADEAWVAAKAVYYDKTVTLTAEGVDAPELVRYGAGKSILVFEDGTEIIHNKDDATFTYDEAKGIVTITVGERVFVIDSSDPSVIGGRMACNVVATNGTALPVFLAIAI